MITSKDYARAYRVYKDGGQVLTERIRQQEQLAPIELLYRRDVVEGADHGSCRKTAL